MFTKTLLCDAMQIEPLAHAATVENAQCSSLRDP